MSFTNTGIYVRMGMPRAVMQKASTIRASIEPCLRTKWIPCFRLASIDSVVFWGRKRVVIIDSEMIGARNESAFRPKHHFSPSFARAVRLALALPSPRR